MLSISTMERLLALYSNGSRILRQGKVEKTKVTPQKF